MDSGHEGGMIVFEVTEDEKVQKSEISKLTVSYETAKELYRIGVTHNSAFSYYRRKGGIVLDVTNTYEEKLLSAFIAQELHELIPEIIEVDLSTYLAHLTGYDRLTEKEIKQEYLHAVVTVQKTEIIDTPYMAICCCKGRMVAFSINEDGRYNNIISWGENQAEALADMVISLKQEGKIDWS